MVSKSRLYSIERMNNACFVSTLSVLGLQLDAVDSTRHKFVVIVVVVVVDDNVVVVVVKTLVYTRSFFGVVDAFFCYQNNFVVRFQCAQWTFVIMSYLASQLFFPILPVLCAVSRVELL